ncbi:DUF1214 domain-containing protein [Prescottella agglutinans]|uniref:DUF1214 domain-containing protein n=1 Tax=Prescottella agglutinans TaxID=1644129 RepID=A0A438B7A2_9NOCA|nr:DUF1214 domain-containing protein [Prescottella agglutinans]RVW06833.1 DUF1214 domain-containing protein [Prescottella agglutinans]
MNATWEKLCTDLLDVGKILSDPIVPQDPLTQAEGVRYLSRLLRYATINCVEYTDPRWPQFTSAPNPNMMTKIGADNPDNVYMRANISGKYTYRITGTRGTVPLVTFGSRINRYHIDGTMLQTGDLHIHDLEIGQHGRFEFIASAEKPADGTAWLPLDPESNLISVRQTYQDRRNEVIAELSIECLNPDGEFVPLSPEEIGQRLDKAVGMVRGTANTFLEWSRKFQPHTNEVFDWGQDYFQNAGGDPTIFYLHGYWKLAEDEAWVIETEVPNCEYFNFVLQNFWVESLDYNRTNIYVNNHTAKLNDDGTLTIVVSAKDPGYGNWISTDAHAEGTWAMRWIKADSHPIPTSKVVKL